MKVKDCEKCNGCPLQRLFPENHLVPPKSGPGLRLAVAEAPGLEESQQLEPLVGPSGRIINMLWRKAGVSRDGLTIINTINCRPPENVFPTDGAARKYCTEQEGKDAVSHCYFGHVRPLLLSRPWSRVDLIGAKALKLLVGTSDIMRWRGSSIEIDTDEIDKRLKTNG